MDSSVVGSMMGWLIKLESQKVVLEQGVEPIINNRRLKGQMKEKFCQKKNKK